MTANNTVRASNLFNGSLGTLPDVEVVSIEYDSRKVVPGSCFVAVKGGSTDGHLYIGQAIERGASLVITQEDAGTVTGDVPVIRVDDSRTELARLADRFYGHPSARLGVVGVTGTNGKTTVTYLLQEIFSKAGFDTSRFGTISYEFPESTEHAANTTPESADLQKMFSKAASYRNPRCIMEVSSHGLAMGRVNHTKFKGAVFTNLTQDHLDFHNTMEEYESAKKKLFDSFSLEYAVINIDDPVGNRWVREGLGESRRCRVISFGESPDANIRIIEKQSDFNGSKIKISSPAGELEIFSKLPGFHNVQNCVAAVAVGIADGIKADDIINGIASLDMVPGRFQRVDEGQEFNVIVDYAHTDNALKNLLNAARPITSGNLICLFGCGGDRDKGKRQAMGRITSLLADRVVVTSDNPRSEDPDEIVREIVKGIPEKFMEKTMVIVSRREAIEHAIKTAKAGDTLLIAGKGHEDYQIVGSKKFDFDDRKVAADILRRMK